MLFHTVEPLQAWIRSRSALARALERSGDPLAELPMTIDETRLTGHVVLVGYGRVGQRIADALAERGVALVVAEQNRELVERLRERGIPAVSGDASEPAVLIQAHIARARMLVVATPDTFSARKMIELARTLKSDIDTVVRTHSDEEASLFQREKVGKVLMGEHELALSMTRHVLQRMVGGSS
jgi:CPA2 family monovalent cation:H+ antiporter-2